MATERIRIHKDDAVDLGSKTVLVLVGARDPTTFTVHENLIRSSSQFFDKALENGWKEAADRVVKLPKDDPNAFRLYVHWLSFSTMPSNNAAAGEMDNNEHLLLATAYVLGDKLQDDTFCDAVLDAMIEKASHPETAGGKRYFPCARVISHVYRYTQPSSPARNLLVSMYASTAKKDWLTDTDWKEVLPREFLVDLSATLLDKTSYSDPTLGESTCRFHRHGLALATGIREVEGNVRG